MTTSPGHHPGPSEAAAALRAVHAAPSGWAARDPRVGGLTVTWADRVIRWATVVSVGAVTAIAAVISYRHAYQLVHRYGETGLTARVLPLTIDGLIATCSLVILDCARRARRPPWHAWALLAAGVAATLGANIAHGADHGPIGALVAGWPAIVAVGSFELATRLLKANAPTKAPAAGPDFRQQGGAADPLPARTRVLDPEVIKARENFADLLAAGELPSLRALKQELRIGHAKARRIRAVLTDPEHRPVSVTGRGPS